MSLSILFLPCLATGRSIETHSLWSSWKHLSGLVAARVFPSASGGNQKQNFAVTKLEIGIMASFCNLLERRGGACRREELEWEQSSTNRQRQQLLFCSYVTGRRTRGSCWGGCPTIQETDLPEATRKNPTAGKKGCGKHRVQAGALWPSSAAAGGVGGWGWVSGSVVTICVHEHPNNE